jgi:GH24 family phage-related lysozyme (muramidase)
MVETVKAGHGANAGLRLGPKGDQLIRQWEGLRLKAYRDTEGILTIGYGTTAASGVVFGPDSVITKEQAQEYMHATVARVYGAEIKRLVKVPLRQAEYDALCSFVYNVGTKAFAQSTLLKKLNRGEYTAVPHELMRWTKSRSGNASRGLLNRRSAEVALWQSTGRGITFASSRDMEPADKRARAEEVEHEDTEPPATAHPGHSPAPPSSDKPAYKSTTIQAATATVLGGATLVSEKSDQIESWLSSGRVIDYVLVAVVLLGIAWVVYARLYRDQDALLK